MEKLAQVLEENKLRQAPVPSQSVPEFSGHEAEEFQKLLSFLLGKDAAGQDLSSSELLTKLASSLKIISDMLNQIAETIDTTLLGRRTEVEAIGQVSYSIFDKTEQPASLKDYLDQIKGAFVIAQQGFRQAVQSRVGEILFDLNPERLEAAAGRGLKFGPMRKAEMFEIYKEKYNACQRWFEAGHLVEEVLREFEKSCQRIYSEKGNEGRKNS
jgi:hypothetical protein